MRLSEIRDYITNILDYDPANTTFDGQTDDIINDCYRRLFAEKPFLFAQKEAKVTAYKDVEVPVIPTGLTNIMITSAPNSFPEWIEGHIVAFDGEELTVLFRLDPTTIYVDKTFDASASAGTATFKMRYIDMPQDCTQILQVAKRSLTITPVEPGRMIPLTRYEDEWWNLPLDEVNMPYYWVQYDDYNIVAPRRVAAAGYTVGAGQGVRTIDVAMTYQYGVGATYRESAISKVTTLTLSDTQNLQITNENLGADAFAYRKIYVRCSDEDLNVWRLVADSSGQSTTIAPNISTVRNYDVSLSSLQSQTWEQNNPRFTYPDGCTQRVRLYPRQDADYDMTVRYMYRPPRLVEDHDTPEFPNAHHLVLAYMALEQIYMKTDNLTQSNMYKMKADSEVVKMEKRYLTQAPKRWVKQFMPDGQTDAQPIYTALRHTP